MRSTRAVFAICGLSTFLLIACDDGGTSYTPCLEDADCPAEQACLANECRDTLVCTQDSDCAADGRVCLAGYCKTAECNQDADCAQGAFCVAHQCTDDPPCDCATDADCEATEQCVNGCLCRERPCNCATDADCLPTEMCEDSCRCVVRPPRPCTLDSECLTGELCLDATCQLAPSCAVDADCPAGTVCEGGSCARPCAQDSDCGNLHTCQDGHCYQQCISDATCQEPNTICENQLCVPAECATDADCAGVDVRCRSGRCEPYVTCSVDADCPDVIYECLNQICEERRTCAIDDNCEAEEVCTDGHCFPVPTCQGEADCTADQDCIGGRCLPHICRGPADCAAGEICLAGTCTTGGDPGIVYQVVILTPGGPIAPGQQIQLEALALTQAGQEVPGIAFTWDTTEPLRASVDGGGLMTAGDEAGDVAITATASGTTRTSDPVVFTNVGAPAVDTLRVTVVSAVDRLPIENATVVLEVGGNSASATTDADGMASFAAPGGLASVHVFSADHDYLSIVGTTSLDLLAPLSPRSLRTSAGGFQGQMTYQGTGSLSLGLAGTSIAGNLVDIGFAELLGQIFNVTVNLGTQSMTLPLPAQLTLVYSYNGMPIPIKNTYYVIGQPGLRTAWAMGGNIDGSVLFDLVGGGSSIEEVLIELLPYFSLLYHGVRPTQDIFPMPLVTDTDDIDGDGDTTEARPDWAQFADLDLAPAQEQDLAVQVTVPPLPSHGGLPVRTAVILAGSMTALGFTPLGMTSAQGDAGAIDPVVMKLAPPYGGLEQGRYATVVMGFPPGTQAELPSDLAAVVASGADLPTDVTFPTGFLAFPEDAQWNTGTRGMISSGVAGAGLYRATFTTDAGQWTVYLPSSGAVALTLPVPPGGMDDLAAGATVTLDPMALVTGMDFEALVGFDGDDLDQLNRLAVAFTTYTLP